MDAWRPWQSRHSLELRIYWRQNIHVISRGGSEEWGAWLMNGGGAGGVEEEEEEEEYRAFWEEDNNFAKIENNRKME